MSDVDPRSIDDDGLAELIARALDRFEPVPDDDSLLVADLFDVLHADALVAELVSDTLVGGAPVRSDDDVDRQLRFQIDDHRIDITLDAAGALIGRVTPPGHRQARVVGDREQLLDIDEHGRFLGNRPRARRTVIHLLGGAREIVTHPRRF